MKNVLITGDSGYIGSHLKKMIARTRKDITVTGLNLSNADLRWPASVKRAGGDVNWDCVIHLGALVKVGESVEEPTDYFETNVNGTINALRYLNCTNFIFASTGAAANPDSPYGLSKLMAEKVVEEAALKSAIDFTTFRFYNVIGQDGFEPTNPDGLFYNLKKAIQTKHFNLFGTDYNTKDGTCVREYVHVNDICWAIIQAIDKPSNSVENLAYGDTRTVKEIIDIFKNTNSVDFVVTEMPRRPGDLEAYYLPSPSKYMVRDYSYEEMLKI